MDNMADDAKKRNNFMVIGGLILALVIIVVIVVVIITQCNKRDDKPKSQKMIQPPSNGQPGNLPPPNAPGSQNLPGVIDHHDPKNK